jgi:hypothetical protein
VWFVRERGRAHNGFELETFKLELTDEEPASTP